ncbi:hypothetical protein AB0M45_17885 [Nocardia sp. NPDC051787]|uniref:hypothetical protein n=1 Tax=Nocardia sp. NPDC051787 TaxID=3155415 RepID=UPI0034310B38
MGSALREQAAGAADEPWLADLMDLHIWAIDRHIEDMVSAARLHGYQPGPDVHEMAYSYGEMVSLLTADFVRCRREERQPGGITEDQVLHHVRHWDGFNAMVKAVAAGGVRLRIPRGIARHAHSERGHERSGTMTSPCLTSPTCTFASCSAASAWTSRLAAPPPCGSCASGALFEPLTTSP